MPLLHTQLYERDFYFRVGDPGQQRFKEWDIPLEVDCVSLPGHMSWIRGNLKLPLYQDR